MLNEYSKECAVKSNYLQTLCIFLFCIVFNIVGAYIYLRITYILSDLLNYINNVTIDLQKKKKKRNTHMKFLIQMQQFFAHRV